MPWRLGWRRASRREGDTSKSRVAVGFGMTARLLGGCALVVLAVLALAGCTGPGGASDGGPAAMIDEPVPVCSPHGHSTFRVFVHQERIDFDLDRYALMGENPEAAMPFQIHMHRGEGGEVIHWEPQGGACPTLGQWARLVEMRVAPGELELWGAHDDAGQGFLLREDVNEGTMRAWAAAPGASWQPLPLDGLESRLGHDCERLLFVWGDDRDDAVERLQAGVPLASQCAG